MLCILPEQRRRNSDTTKWLETRVGNMRELSNYRNADRGREQLAHITSAT